MTPTPVTKLWYMTLKDSTNSEHPDFRQAWTEVLDFCNLRTSGEPCSAHQLWQHITFPSCVIMITGYASRQAVEDADNAYVKNGFLKRMAQFVEHKRLLVMETDVTALPIDAQYVEIDVSSSHTAKNAKLAFGPEIAVRKEVTEEAMEQGRKETGDKIFVSIKALEDMDVKQLLEPLPLMWHAMYLKKIM